MSPFLYQWLQDAQNALLAPRCLLCQAPATLDTSICAGCHAELPWLGRACELCALPLPGKAATLRCRACQKRPCFDAGVAACRYEQPMPWLIGQLKFAGRRHHAPLLGDLLAQAVLASGLVLPDRLLCVPLHVKAYRRRGFNQAERITHRLSQRLGVPMSGAVLQRTRNTPAQVGLSAARRAANVRDAFAVRHTVADAHVAIVDDVVTTSRTAAELARVLYRAGARRVDVYCVARA